MHEHVHNWYPLFRLQILTLFLLWMSQATRRHNQAGICQALDGQVCLDPLWVQDREPVRPRRHDSQATQVTRSGGLPRVQDADPAAFATSSGGLEHPGRATCLHIVDRARRLRAPLRWKRLT